MANASIIYGLRAAVVTSIRALITAGTITGVESTSVRNRPVPSAKRVATNPGAGELSFPCILVSNGGKESIEPANNIRDDIGYPVLVTVFDDRLQDVDQSDDDFQAWRAAIIDEFRHGGYTLADPSTDFHNVIVEPGPLIDWKRFQEDGKYAGSFILRFITRR